MGDSREPGDANGWPPSVRLRFRALWGPHWMEVRPQTVFRLRPGRERRDLAAAQFLVDQLLEFARWWSIRNVMPPAIEQRAPATGSLFPPELARTARLFSA